MLLPNSLRSKLDKAIDKVDQQKIQCARRDLTKRYRDVSKNYVSISPLMTTAWDRLSYMATRMPATYAVCCRVFDHLKNNETKITSLLDLGAGPGTVFWAAHALFSDLNQVTLIEQDDALLQSGIALFDESMQQKNIISLSQSFETAIPFKSHDLVCMSYVLGELSPSHQMSLIQAAWQATTEFLVLIEPGTPEGFERIKAARHHLIQQDGVIVAPCPHNASCPMTQGDWCHFSQRLERSFHHRQIKEGSLPYEDEKYSYIIVAKTWQHRPSGRIIRRPKQGSGHLILDLCTTDGLKRKIISKKTQTLYRLARGARWGDCEPEDTDIILT